MTAIGTRAFIRALCTIVAAHLTVLLPPSRTEASDKLRLQLMWTHQAQFAGIYVAVSKGYYAREGIDLEIIEGGPGIAPIERLRTGDADVALAWLPAALAARLRGHDVVNIAQIFRHPGIAIVCRRGPGLQSPADVSDKTIGVWNTGDELQVRYWLRTLGISSDSVRIVQQRSDALDLIERRVDCATAMMYNEYWSILQSGLSPGELFHVRFADSQQGFLDDGIYVNAETLQDKRRHQALVRFLRATLAGWQYARENPEEALAITMASAPGVDAAHQRRMLQSVLQLIGNDRNAGLLELSSYWSGVGVMASEGAKGQDMQRAAHAGWTHSIWRATKPAGGDPFALSQSTRHYLTETVRSRWFYVLDLAGTVAFGIAGFMRAEQRRYNLWGALILTLLPAVGGGTLRDLLVGGDRHPPFMFKDPTYLYLVLAIVALGAWLARILPEGAVGSRTFERSLTFFDTVGMATFTVIGAQVALIAGLHWFWVPFCAALTCAGGSMLLDVVTGREPRTFQGEPYEEIAVLGGLMLLLGLWLANKFEHSQALVAAVILATMASVFVLRLCVVKYRLRSYRLRG
ncbi:ABC transporter substrate-binding protein [Hyphomicrobium sp. CS1BSMeth3]|uniref:ABC transporter substrate-binding protein n=1 Tax=Hyphomicrobium sp. CS1BSMeth3 TaxID=1892844 RepID=UPI000930F9EA|nr:ABC transporter substrate-binding protein [Hyphomicrobium sp. CS1BSMeth3]